MKYEYRMVKVFDIMSQEDINRLQTLLDDWGTTGWKVVCSHNEFIVLMREIEGDPE